MYVIIRITDHPQLILLVSQYVREGRPYVLAKDLSLPAPPPQRSQLVLDIGHYHAVLSCLLLLLPVFPSLAPVDLCRPRYARKEN